jgi:hypothetical protein
MISDLFFEICSSDTKFSLSLITNAFPAIALYR